MEPTFRLAKDSDIDILVEFMRQFYAIDGYPFEDVAARRAMGKIVQDPTLGRAWMICDGDVPIGYIVLTFGYSLEYQGRDAFIDEFYIDAAQRNKGVGSKTLEFALEVCLELDINALHLEVEPMNAAGLALYGKFGFVDHNRRLMTRRIGK
jgi:GNAT superfamily N-acetyltransferase